MPALSHGMSHSRLHRIWDAMRQRCNNPKKSNFFKYGAKGIRVCKEWEKFETFRDWALSNGYADTLTIDRIDPTGDYTPANCRWATYEEQANNRTNSIRITYHGEMHSIRTWSALINVPYRILYERYHMGWKPERIIEQPVKKRRCVQT